MNARGFPLPLPGNPWGERPKAFTLFEPKIYMYLEKNTAKGGRREGGPSNKMVELCWLMGSDTFGWVSALDVTRGVLYWWKLCLKINVTSAKHIVFAEGGRGPRALSFHRPLVLCAFPSTLPLPPFPITPCSIFISDTSVTKSLVFLSYISVGLSVTQSIVYTTLSFPLPQH